MISIHLMGGLGNQLFQIATTIAYAIDNHITPIFPYSETLTTGQTRNTYWHSLLQNIRKFTVLDNKQFTNEMLYQLPKYHEPDFRYVPLPSIDKIENHRMIGYFQSWKYFDHVKTQVLSIMGITQQRLQIKHDYSELLCITDTEKFPKTISVHFRLGDYKTKQDCHPILPYEYYDRAFQFFSREFLEDVRVLYFCEEDDCEVVDDIMIRIQDKYYLQDIERIDHTIPDWKQLLIMSCCRVNIIANSSFSWWAAYINDHPFKTVIYPSMWFGSTMSNIDVSDMFPTDDSWIRVLC
jgi:hypothetical protein